MGSPDLVRTSHITRTSTLYCNHHSKASCPPPSTITPSPPRRHPGVPSHPPPPQSNMSEGGFNGWLIVLRRCPSSLGVPFHLPNSEPAPRAQIWVGFQQLRHISIFDPTKSRNFVGICPAPLSVNHRTPQAATVRSLQVPGFLRRRLVHVWR